MAQDVISTSKWIQDSGMDVAGVALVDLLVTLDLVDSSSCLFSDTTLEWILGMATVDVPVVEWLDSLAFFSLFFGTFNLFTVFQILDVYFTATALVRKFVFKKKVTKREQLLCHEGIGIQRVVFVWGRS